MRNSARFAEYLIQCQNRRILLYISTIFPKYSLLNYNFCYIMFHSVSKEDMGDSGDTGDVSRGHGDVSPSHEGGRENVPVPPCPQRKDTSARIFRREFTCFVRFFSFINFIVSGGFRREYSHFLYISAPRLSFRFLEPGSLLSSSLCHSAPFDAVIALSA